MRTVVLFFLFAWLLCFQQCSARDTLKAGEKLFESDNHTILVSEGKNFTLGFFSPPGSTHKFLGIWYHRLNDLEPQIVVWVANRDNPIQNSSSGVVGIAEDGNLVVTDTSGNGKTYWSSGLEGSASRNSTLKLMDSGNLLLLDPDLGMRNPLWQSFKHPTDTFLPGMKMDSNLNLTSWRNSSDPGIGNFTFKMAPTRDNRYIILKNNFQLHWESDGLNSEAIPPDILYLLADIVSTNSSHTLNNRTLTWKSQSFDYNNSRIFVNSTGEVQYLTRSQGESEWRISWNRPEDKCGIYNFCGNFGSCNMDNSKHCKCLPGFRWNNQGQGCVRKSTSCVKDELMFLNLTMIKVRKPDKYVPARTEAECQSECLKGCPHCQAYSYNATYSERGKSFTCGIWTQDLPSLQEGRENGGGDLSILVKTSDIAPTAKSCEPCGTYVIPYPLSTGQNCGDPMYSKFNCNVTTGQVSFVVLPGDQSYRVTWIDEDARKFYVKMTDSSPCDDDKKLNSPFFASDWCSDARAEEIEVSWQPPPEPPCSKAIDCKNWPYSTCKATGEGTRRCLCDSNYKWSAFNLTCTQGPSRKRRSLILWVTVASMIFLACTIVFACVWRKRLAHNKDQISIQIQESLNDSERHVKGLIGLEGLTEKDSEGIEVPCYTFASIIAATDNFSDSNKLGRGGYGPVYKGRFPGGQVIAIKRLSSVSTQGLQEFKNEVVLIAKLQHRNLVRLRGYCIKGDEKILLYEYMPNKSLDLFIFDRTRTFLLDWKMRFDIILGIARGLLYLHQDSRLRVIHRDMKTSNILLDEEMNPKISDFGLARIFGGKETEASTERVVGTYGYMAPEYALDGIFSIKSDVFSFGVVLLEILSGKRNTGFYESKQISSLLGYAWRLWTENKLLGLMDLSMGETCDENQFIKCALIGLLCVQDEPGDRPTMSTVVIMLESEAATIPTPTQPTFFVSRSRGLSSTASSSSKPETSLHLESSYQEGR